jgi:hypothetical protein
MQKLDDLIKRFDDSMFEGVELHTAAKLKMIRTLFNEIQGSRDIAYMDEIVGQFVEILDYMQDIIEEQTIEIAQNQGYGPMTHSYMAAAPIAPEQKEQERPSCLPPEGGFQEDDQAKKAFSNYLVYHVERRTKKNQLKPFSSHTIYDYTSRIKVLMEIVQEEWDNGAEWLQLNPELLREGQPFLNAYHHIPVLREYVIRKEEELMEIAKGIRPAPEGKKNPLNNSRNLNNTSAALAKFEAFRDYVEEMLFG